MAIRFREDANFDNCSTVARARFYTPSGEIREIATNVSNEFMDDNPRAMAYAYESMRRQALEEVNQGFNQQMMYYSNNSTAVTNNLSWGNDYSSYDNVSSGQMVAHVGPRSIKLKFKIGKRTLEVSKTLDGDSMELSEQDIDEAKVEYIRSARIAIITRKADKRADELLSGFISEVDFRNYQERGFFTVKQGNRLFRIYKDKHKKIDMWEREGNLFVPKNRLCVHTQKKDLPDGDEALARLLLVRSGGLMNLANKWDSGGMETANEEELVLCNK